MKVHFIRYADDFIVSAPTKEIAEEIRDIIREFLVGRGLELSEEKTRITHINEGFDFLGWNIRKYKGTLLIKPSKKSIKAIMEKIKAIIQKAQAWTQDQLIKALNPVIRGWSNYHRHIVAKETFAKLDSYIWTVIWRWGKRRHRNKGHKWIARKYWHSKGNRNWVFQTTENTLLTFSEVNIRRHTFLKLDANPYTDRKYFLDRQDRLKKQTPWNQTKLSYFALRRPIIG